MEFIIVGSFALMLAIAAVAAITQWRFWNGYGMAQDDERRHNPQGWEEQIVKCLDCDDWHTPREACPASN